MLTTYQEIALLECSQQLSFFKHGQSLFICIAGPDHHSIDYLVFPEVSQEERGNKWASQVHQMIMIFHIIPLLDIIFASLHHHIIIFYSKQEEQPPSYDEAMQMSRNQTQWVRILVKSESLKLANNTNTEVFVQVIYDCDDINHSLSLELTATELLATKQFGNPSPRTHLAIDLLFVPVF